MINLNVTGTKNTLQSFSLFNISVNLRKRNENQEGNKSQVVMERLHLISPYSRFCAVPDFDICDATMDPTLTTAFYNVAIKLTNDFDFTDEEFSYYKKNFGAHMVKTKLELIEFLIKKRDLISRNDSRYYSGFRSVYIVLRNNLDSVTFEYICEINKVLTPFFLSFKHKESLIPGLEYLEKN